MTDAGRLTYYEYWLTKKYWNAEFAIYMLFDYMKHQRGWEASDDYMSAMKFFLDKIKAQMSNEDAEHVFGIYATEFGGWDEVTERYIEAGVDIEASQVKPNEFLQWAYKKGYQLPYEFKAFIGIYEKESNLNTKEQDRIDREVCQGIARTLWDYHPGMEIEEMVDHKAIQIYGSGRLHSRDATLRRWLSEVDPRAVKRGRKKKI